MATTTIMSGSDIGYTNLFEMVANYMGATTMDIDGICKDVINWVNNNLPSSYAWYPYISEVYADIDESEELTEEDLMDYIRQGIEECAVDPEEELCTTLTSMQRTEIQMDICKELVGDDYMVLFESVYPEDRWDMDKFLTGRKTDSVLATVKEYRSAFRDFFEGCI